jgi:hypothetical protein
MYFNSRNRNSQFPNNIHFELILFLREITNDSPLLLASTIYCHLIQGPSLGFPAFIAGLRKHAICSNILMTNAYFLFVLSSNFFRLSYLSVHIVNMSCNTVSCRNISVNSKVKDIFEDKCIFSQIQSLESNKRTQCLRFLSNKSNLI